MAPQRQLPWKVSVIFGGNPLLRGQHFKWWVDAVSSECFRLAVSRCESPLLAEITCLVFLYLRHCLNCSTHSGVTSLRCRTGPLGKQSVLIA